MIKCGYIHNDIMSFYLLVDCDDPFVKYFCTFFCDDDHFGLWHLISYCAPCFHIISYGDSWIVCNFYCMYFTCFEVWDWPVCSQFWS